MKTRMVGWLGMLALVAGCSSGNREVQTSSGDTGVVVVGTRGTVVAKKADNASTAERLGIPPGHLPPVGLCRVWMPGEPPGKQRAKYPAGNCPIVARSVPAGGWLVYRPTKNRKQIEVTVYHHRHRVPTLIRIFDASSGRFIRELALEG